MPFYFCQSDFTGEWLCTADFLNQTVLRNAFQGMTLTAVDHTLKRCNMLPTRSEKQTEKFIASRMKHEGHL